MSQKEDRRLAGILAGAYTCQVCNKPSVAAVETRAGWTPYCAEHARGAERLGYTVIWKLPKGQP